MDLVHQAGESFVRFIGERGRDDLFYAGTASGLSQEPGINPVAGDDSKRVRSLQISQQEITEATEVLKFKTLRFLCFLLLSFET